MIRIQLLGRFTVHRGETELSPRLFSGQRTQQLLRLLALRRGAFVSKDVIAEALWPGCRLANPRGDVAVLVSRIRRALGERTLIEAGPGGYVLTGDARCWVDAEAFLAAVRAGRAALPSSPVDALAAFRAALAMWRGEPLAEDAYRDWAQDDRRHLTLAHLEALEGAAAAALNTGSPREAVAWAEQALGREPLRDTSAILLVQALAACGDQAGALAAFDSFRDVLAGETGLDPTPEAQHIRQRVLRGECLEAGLGRPAVSAATSQRPGSFIGRQSECAALVTAAKGLGPRAVLVTGASGIGKSRLLAEAARLVNVHMPVIAVRAFAPERSEAWSLAGRVLHQAWQLMGNKRPVTTEREAEALASLVPGLPVAAHASTRLLDPESRRAFALQGAARIVEAAGTPGCLIAVDDVQWADPVSLSLLGLVLRRSDHVRLAATCPSHVPLASDSAAAEALGAPVSQVQHIALAPLPAGATRELFGDQSLADIILTEAANTPFEITEITGALARSGIICRDDHDRWQLGSRDERADARAVVIAGLRKLAATRLAALPRGECESLGFLAVLGRPAPPALIAGASGRPLRDVLDALEDLGRRELAHAGQRGWVIRHELIGRAVLGMLSAGERTRMHALLAEALRRGSAEPAEIADHLVASGEHQAAARAYAIAARRQLAQTCDAEALRLAEKGLALEPSGRRRAALLEVRGEARRRHGRLEEARSDLVSALGVLDHAPDRSRVLAHLAFLEARSHETAQGEDLIELAVAEARGQPRPLGQALAAGAIIDLAAGKLRRAANRSRRARRLLEQAGDSAGTARLLYWRAMMAFTAGQLREAAIQFGHLAHLPVAAAEMLRLWNPRATRGHALAFMAQPEAGLEDIEEALAWAKAVDYPAVVSACLWRRSEALAFLGKADDAVESAEQAVAIAARIQHAEWTAASLRSLGIAWEAAGMPDRAESSYRRSLEAAHGLPFFAAWTSARLGACLARQGRPEDAMALVWAAFRQGTPLTRHEARWAHAELLAASGEDDAARAVAADALRKATRGGYLILAPRLRELAGRPCQEPAICP